MKVTKLHQKHPGHQGIDPESGQPLAYQTKASIKMNPLYSSSVNPTHKQQLAFHSNSSVYLDTICNIEGSIFVYLFIFVYILYRKQQASGSLPHPGAIKNTNTFGP